MGNPLSYLGYTFTWENIRNLATVTGNGQSISYTYDDAGIRTSKTVNGVKHEYVVEGSRILSETYGNVFILYLYDEAGLPIGMAYRKSSYAPNEFDKYYFTKNLQGDILNIYSEDGTKVASYTYDAWGNHTVTNYTSDNIGNINPFRYRGYYFDSETGFYYLNRRYYSPEIKRFINADSINYLGANGDMQAFNLYAYCSNNPVMFVDPSGKAFLDVLKNFFKNIWKSIEGEVGIGIGIGLSGEISAVELEIEGYRDNTLFLEDGNFVLGNVVSTEGSIMGIGAGGKHIQHCEGSDSSHGHPVYGTFFDIVEYGTNCPKCEHQQNFTFNDTYSFGENDFAIGIGASFHFLLGGHAKIGFNFTEFFNRIGDDWRK